MFKIDSKFQYIFHFASTEEIANAIKDDLASREECEYPGLVEIENCEDEPASWDPGGILMVNDKTFIFKLKNIAIEIKRQHFSYFVDWVQHAELREWFDTKYYKIHSGYLSCLCITHDEFEELKFQLNNSELALAAMASIQARQAAIEGAFIQVAKVKDEDGNPVVVKVKRQEHTLN